MSEGVFCNTRQVKGGRMQTAEFQSRSIGEKLILLAGASLIILSFIALACFVSVSAVSLITWRTSHYWNACFLLCSFALGGWMILYAGQLRLGGGVFVYRNNVLLLFFLIFAVLISAVARFASPQRYVAIFILVLSLAAFHIAVPGITSPNMLIRLLRNENITEPPRGPHA